MQKITLTDGTNPIEIDIGKFPGGEIRVKIIGKVKEHVYITAYLFNSDDVMTLMMLNDAVRRAGAVSVRLTMPYIPYARQDRVCNMGEAFSLEVFANLINMMKFNSVVVYDAHSEVALSFIERCIEVPQKDIVTKNKSFLKLWNEAPSQRYLVSPDAGAFRKIYGVARYLNAEIIIAKKIRDPATGQIMKTEVENLPDDVEQSSLFIVDDICDFGTTFVELSKILRPQCKELNLFVTHGIFSGGKERMLTYFDNVLCEIDFEYEWNVALNKFTNS